jgi:nitrous oxidase accessory protein NosD
MAGKLRTVSVALAGAVAMLTVGVLVAPAASANSARHLFVSTKGTDSGACGAASKPCRTIGQAVTNAAPGGEVSVAEGRYAESVSVGKRLELEGHDATIDAKGKINGVALSAGASWSRVHGFTVTNAIGEGIVATANDRVRIDDNVVENNDQGGQGTPTSYPLCQAQGPIPGDCGEAVHLDGTTHARLDHNLVQNNVGGILVSDDAASSHDNWITHNVAKNNKLDCGITMPSHTSNGVHDNVIAFNTSTGNGGAGVLLAASGPTTKDDNNLVTGNRIWGNGEVGVQLHAHAPNQSIEGNRIIDNWIGTNNTAGDRDAGDLQTTGVIVFSAVVPVKSIVIRDNTIANDHFGIWLSKNVSTGGISDNNFIGVAVPVHQ